MFEKLETVRSPITHIDELPIVGQRFSSLQPQKTFTRLAFCVLALTPSLLWSPRTDLLVRAALQVPVFQRWDGPRYDYPTFVLALVLDR